MPGSSINIVSVKAAFVDSALYKVGKSLVTYSASLDGARLFVRIIVLNTMSESEEDDIYDILGGIVGHFNEMTADFEMLKVESISAANEAELLPIVLFHRSL